MHRARWACALIITVLAGSLWAAEPPLTPQEGILVLRNGRILRGMITRLGDRYLVSLGERDEVRISTEKVDFVCADLDQAYQLKRASRLPGVEGRLDLAQWCLRHNLLNEAADQTLAAVVADPANPTVRRMQQRIGLAMERKASPSPNTSPAETVSVAALDRVSRELPPGSIEQFTNTVQPLLLNRCAAGKCHGGTGRGGYQLMRPPLGGITRRFTQRNLFATVRQVDQQNPDASQLLQTARRPHGGSPQAPLGDPDGAHYRQLAEWVEGLSPRPLLAQPRTAPTIGRPEPILLQPSKYPERRTTLRPGGSKKPAVADPTMIPEDNPLPAPPPRVFQPRDPFDPEIFNRRHFSEPGKGNAPAIGSAGR